jgi:hypothetical protein
LYRPSYEVKILIYIRLIWTQNSTRSSRLYILASLDSTLGTTWLLHCSRKSTTRVQWFFNVIRDEGDGRQGEKKAKNTVKYTLIPSSDHVSSVNLDESPNFVVIMEWIVKHIMLYQFSNKGTEKLHSWWSCIRILLI